MKKVKVLIDNGHGYDTPGKRSPDGRLAEWQWTRRLAVMMAARLHAEGIESELLVPEENDVPLKERCRRANARGADCVLLSLHVNAAGDGSSWHEARGYSAFVCPTASAESRRFAGLLTDSARAAGLEGNRCTPPAGYWTAGFAICRGTRCPSVLSECLFQDNREDVEYLLSDAGLTALCEMHVRALLLYMCKP